MGKKGHPTTPVRRTSTKRRCVVAPATPPTPAPVVQPPAQALGPAPTPVVCGHTDTTVNSEILKRVSDARAAILGHELFSDILSTQARNDAGMAPVDLQVLTGALQNSQHYTAAFNIFQVVDLMSFVTHDTPVHTDHTQKLADHFWSPVPNDLVCPYLIVLAAMPSDANDGLRTLPMLSPPEYAWAFLFALEAAINAGSTDAELATFRQMALSFTVRVEVHENQQQRVWRAHQLRQSDTQVGYVAKQSPVQFMYSVLPTKAMLEKAVGHELGVEKTCEAWQQNVKLASCVEPMKLAYIAAVFTIWRRCMQDDVCRHIIHWQDGQALPIFDSAYKLEALVKRATSVPCIRYCLGTIIDMVYNHGACAGEFAVRQLSGKGLPGGKGKIDMILAKKELSQALKTFAVDNKCSDLFVQKLTQ